MNERLAFYADELRDAVYDLDRLDDCDEIRDIKQTVHRVAQDLRAMAKIDDIAEALADERAELARQMEDAERVDELPDGDRGSDGFGSTGR